MPFPVPCILSPVPWLLSAATAAEPVLERLDPPRRAAIIMALLGLTLVGLFLIVLAMLGGHWARRLARHRPGQRSQRSPREPSDAQLRQSLESILPEAKTDDTIQFGHRSGDTKADG
jgi:hypothetical protein